MELFDCAPTNFKDIFWKLVDAKQVPRTVSIVSDDAAIPWELMIPFRSATEVRQPLGVECAVGRWITRDDTSAPQQFPLTVSLVVAPRYADPKRQLNHAETEAAFVLNQVHGERVEPARLVAIREALARVSPNLVHFIGHGADEDGLSESLDLEGGEQLTSTMVRGVHEFAEAFQRTPTLVVLSACDTGRPTVSLSGVGGMAGALIRLGAAGVVGALWSVDDRVAADVTREFYSTACAVDPRPFAEIIQAIRRKAYLESDSCEDTYAAYCFYGDPCARRGQP